MEAKPFKSIEVVKRLKQDSLNVMQPLFFAICLVKFKLSMKKKKFSLGVILLCKTS